MNALDIMMVPLRFNEKINQRDLKGLVSLMTPDHRFTDAAGETHEGREVMKEGWRDFFSSYPDYKNIFTRVQVRDDLVIMIGHSTCSYEPLDGPALWTAKIHQGAVSEWRVYEDTQEQRRNLGVAD
jgi:ketosteroid isomerase-like protein